MSFHTVEDGPWPQGTTVAVWHEDDVSGGVPSGTEIDTAIAQPDGTVTFGGLTEGETYVAFGHGGSQTFEAINQETRLQALAVTAPTRVLALPSSPVDGQEVYYAAGPTTGILWHLRYNAAAASAHKWEWLGGSYLTHEIDTQEDRNSTSYGDGAVVGPSLTFPLAGDYVVEHGAQIFSAVNDQNGSMALSYNGVAPDNAESAIGVTQPVGQQGVLASVSRERVKTGVSAGHTVVAKYICSVAGVASFRRRWLRIRPVRVS